MNNKKKKIHKIMNNKNIKQDKIKYKSISQILCIKKNKKYLILYEIC